MVDWVMRRAERARMSAEERWVKETPEICDETGWEMFIVEGVALRRADAGEVWFKAAGGQLRSGVPETFWKLSCTGHFD